MPISEVIEKLLDLQTTYGADATFRYEHDNYSCYSCSASSPELNLIAQPRLETDEEYDRRIKVETEAEEKRVEAANKYQVTKNKNAALLKQRQEA